MVEWVMVVWMVVVSVMQWWCGMNVCVCDVVYDDVSDIVGDVVHDVLCDVVDDGVSGGEG